MKQLVTGILAHVDAGKTTLSEALLYTGGSIRKLGRVDNSDAFLDTHELERARGITIFSKQAELLYKDLNITLLDTPGHVDFSAEMERTLQILDYGILVINGADGVQGHTHTLWRLLENYGVPVFLFINKMDQKGTDREELLLRLKEKLNENCVDFGDSDRNRFWENTAVCDEAALETYLETGEIEDREISRMILERKLFPCFFGSALKVEGVKEFLEGFSQYTCAAAYPEEFGARVFKIARDAQGNRLTYMKITGGSLRVKTVLTDRLEKVNQIRLYSGEKYELLEEAAAGSLCAVTGLTGTKPGDGLGIEAAGDKPLLAPVLTCQMILPEDCSPVLLLPKLRELEEEEPELHIVWNESLQEIQAQIMGEVQLEILKSLIRERFQTEVEFGAGHIVYKETIVNAVEGVGHYEPLRHYAEVHLLLEPGSAGSGLTFDSRVSTDDLERNWQRLVLSQLEEKEHKGVLIGAELTDIKITLIAGKAHIKHTEGGDFRQAAWRAVRQGLMQAKSILLEPFYDFVLEIPELSVGRAMADLDKRGGIFEITDSLNGMSVIKGSAPVSGLRGYQSEVAAYSRGMGRLLCTFRGYEPCRSALQVMEEVGYDPERDTDNPADSVFCSHGAGMVISWYEVKGHMHLESAFEEEGDEEAEEENDPACHDTSVAYSAKSSLLKEKNEERWIGTEEIDRILERTYSANKKQEKESRFGRSAKREIPAYRTVSESRQRLSVKIEDEYLLVDGYNIIFAWEELSALAKVNIDSARGALLDILCNYQGIIKCRLIAVFDAYRVAGHRTEILEYYNIHVVYTKEAETADQYIEKFAHENVGKHRVTVATSDGLEQIIIRGEGCRLLSAKELKEEIHRVSEMTLETFQDGRPSGKNYLLDGISPETAEQLTKLLYKNQ